MFILKFAELIFCVFSATNWQMFVFYPNKYDYDYEPFDLFTFEKSTLLLYTMEPIDFERNNVFACHFGV